MLEGALFIWFAWMGIIILIFFVNPSKSRDQLLLFCLAIICVANLHIPVAIYEVNAALILCWLLGYFLLMKYLNVKKLYAALVVIMLTAIYASIELFSIYDPVFSYLYTAWSIGLVLFIIVHLTVNNTGLRCSLLILSVVQGELILSVIYQQMGIQTIIGRFVSLDIMAVSVMGTTLWYGFVQLTAHFENVVKKHQERRGYS